MGNTNHYEQTQYRSQHYDNGLAETCLSLIWMHILVNSVGFDTQTQPHTSIISDQSSFFNLRLTSNTPHLHLKHTSNTPHLKHTSDTPQTHLRHTSETPQTHLKHTSNKQCHNNSTQKLNVITETPTPRQQDAIDAASFFWWTGCARAMSRDSSEFE